MATAKTSLTIIGKPGEAVRVVPRDRGDDPPPDVWSGKLDKKGQITIEVPQGYLVVVCKNRDTAPLPFHETKPKSYTLRLADAKK